MEGSADLVKIVKGRLEGDQPAALHAEISKKYRVAGEKF